MVILPEHLAVHNRGIANGKNDFFLVYYSANVNNASIFQNRKL